MRLVIQRVEKASVSVNNQTVGDISQGLLILVAVSPEDSENEIHSLAKKVLNLRILEDENQKMNLSAIGTNSGILLIPQFTLYAQTDHGNRPYFGTVAKPKKAKEFFDLLTNRLKESGLTVETGEFGAHMSINAQLDGPVTIILES